VSPVRQSSTAHRHAVAIGSRGHVCLVVDDPLALRDISQRLEAAGFDVEAFSSAEAFHGCQLDAPGCVIGELRSHGRTGLELQDALRRTAEPPPVIFLATPGDVSSSVRAMKQGAVDILARPVSADALLDAVRRAIALDADARAQRRAVRELRARYERLTPREREVFALVTRGLLNKQIAGELGAAERTVKLHRARVMEKMEVASVAELTRAAERLGRIATLTDPVVFSIDRHDAIVEVNDAWTTFALANDAPELIHERVLQRSFWDFIVDATTRQLYGDLLLRVRRGMPVQFPFRCDSPTARRHLEMRLTPGPDGTVQFESVVLASELRVQQPLWDRYVRRGEDLVRVCGWCKRVELAGEWAEVETAIGRLRIFERHDMPSLTHGICPECLEAMQRVSTLTSAGAPISTDAPGPRDASGLELRGRSGLSVAPPVRSGRTTTDSSRAGGRRRG
jgi:FixJ family two-component response regulator